MAGTRLHNSLPPAGQMMTKPVPVKPKKTPMAVNDQGSLSGIGKGSTPSQRLDQKSSTRHMGPNGWRPPRKGSSDTGQLAKATKEAEEDGDENDSYSDDPSEEEEKSRSWWRRMEGKETCSGGEQKRLSAPRKDCAEERRWPRAKKELLASGNEDEFELKSHVLSRDKAQLTRSSLDNNDTFEHHHRMSQGSFVDSGYASSSNSLSSPLELPATPPSQENSASLRSTQSLDDELTRRLDEIRLDKGLTKQNADLVNLIQECVFHYLNHYDNNRKWTKCNQGSYYEKVKVGLCS